MQLFQYDKVRDLVGTLNHWTDENDVPPVDDYLKDMAALQTEVGVLAAQDRHYNREAFTLLISLPGLMASNGHDIFTLSDLLVLKYKPLPDYVLGYMQHKLTQDEFFRTSLLAFYGEDYMVDLFEGESRALFLKDKESLTGVI